MLPREDNLVLGNRVEDCFYVEHFPFYLNQ